MAPKRTLDAFFGPAPKRARAESPDIDDRISLEPHPSQTPPPPPFPPLGNRSPSAHAAAARAGGRTPAVPVPHRRPARAVAGEPGLDLLCFEPFLPAAAARALFGFVRAELPFYRVEYEARRAGAPPTRVRTPRWTSVFGVNATAAFAVGGALVDAASGAPVAADDARARGARPIPLCLDALRRAAEAATACRFNVCLVNYYASGADAIAFHSDDERFLSRHPAIASFSLGARRDFVLKPKPRPAHTPASAAPAAAARPLRLSLASGDMVLMRGPTQANWLHSVPRRTGRHELDGGRVNITFRRAMVKEGTDNYYRYNVGDGPVYRWDKESRQMAPWTP